MKEFLKKNHAHILVLIASLLISIGMCIGWSTIVPMFVVNGLVIGAIGWLILIAD